MLANMTQRDMALKAWPRLRHVCRGEDAVSIGIASLAERRKEWETLDKLDMLASDRDLFEAARPYLAEWLRGDDSSWHRTLAMVRHGDNVVYAATRGRIAPILRGCSTLAKAGFRRQAGEVVEAVEAGLRDLSDNSARFQDGKDIKNLLPEFIEIEKNARVPRTLMEAAMASDD